MSKRRYPWENMFPRAAKTHVTEEMTSAEHSQFPNLEAGRSPQSLWSSLHTHKISEPQVMEEHNLSGIPSNTQQDLMEADTERYDIPGSSNQIGNPVLTRQCRTRTRVDMLRRSEKRDPSPIPSPHDPFQPFRRLYVPNLPPQSEMEFDNIKGDNTDENGNEDMEF